MRDVFLEVQRWRQKADELRAAAENLRNEVARDALLEMAKGYEALADRIEDLKIESDLSP